MSKRTYILGAADAGRLSEPTIRKLERAEVGFEGAVVVTIEKETRNLRQNALMWAWWEIVGNHFGHSSDGIHAITKEALNVKVILWPDTATGELKERKIIRDTHDMRKDEFAEFLQRAQQFWSEQGVNLPSSEEYFAEQPDDSL